MNWPNEQCQIKSDKCGKRRTYILLRKKAELRLGFWFVKTKLFDKYRKLCCSLGGVFTLLMLLNRTYL